MARKFFVGGNYKMNGTKETLSALVKTLNDADLDPNTEVVVAPPALYILPLKELLRKDISVAAQNAYVKKEGAYTGELSPYALSQENVPWVILGHSERRSLFNESSDDVAQKVKAAQEFGLSVILCVGEKLEERESNKTEQVVKEQIDAVIKANVNWDTIVIAYEPVWAIGTGKVATPEQAQDTHAYIRKYLGEAVSSQVADATRIIYGGSVNGANSGTLAKGQDIDGFLVGGASLKPEFVQIVNANKA